MEPCEQITGQLSNETSIFKWDVSRAAIAGCKNKHDKLLSAEFSVGNSRWQLCLQPKGNEASKIGFMAISLCLRSFTTQEFRADVEIYLMNAYTPDEVLHLEESENTAISNGYSEVFPNFIDLHTVVYEDNLLLVDDNLPIFLKIVPRGHVHREISLTFENLFDNQKFSDVKIALGNDEYLHAHKNILACQSSVFAAMFEHKMKENIENLIEIEDVDRDIIVAMVRFMYSGKINNIEKIAKRLLVAADRYDVGSLKFICEEYLCNSLSLENAVEYLILANNYNAGVLDTKAIDFVVSNIGTIIDTPEFKAYSDGDVLMKVIRKLALEKTLPKSI